MPQPKFTITVYVDQHSRREYVQCTDVQIDGMSLTFIDCRGRLISTNLKYIAEQEQ